MSKHVKSKIHVKKESEFYGVLVYKFSNTVCKTDY